MCRSGQGPALLGKLQGLMTRNTAAAAAVDSAVIAMAMLSQCLSVSDRVSVRLIQFPLLPYAHEVHPASRQGHHRHD